MLHRDLKKYCLNQLPQNSCDTNHPARSKFARLVCHVNLIMRS